MALPPRLQSFPKDTLIIWDWDDTLMCSTAINSKTLQPGHAPQLEALLEEALRASMALGETLIVTNADDLWVFESTRRFAPHAMPLLSQLPIISARRRQEMNFPRDVFAWKRETFREIFSSRPNAQGLNLVVLGDSPAEIEAAQTGSYGLAIHPLLIKTVKFKETPTCDELCDQLRLIIQDLASIVHDDKDGNRNLATSFRSPASQYNNFRGATASSVHGTSFAPLSSYGIGGEIGARGGSRPMREAAYAPGTSSYPMTYAR